MERLVGNEVAEMDCLKLKLLDLRHADNLEYLHELVQNRLNVYRRVAECAEGNEVALVSSGMDCDCSAWSNRVSMHVADAKAVLVTMAGEYEDAEGPLSIRIMRPSEARRLKCESRDLALAAFEDGHAHVVYY